VYRELLQATCTYPAHLRRDSETIVAQVNSVGDGRQPGQRESYECIRRTHHGILGQKEKVKLAGSRETRLRGKQAEGGRFLKLTLDVCAVGRWALGLPINIVIKVEMGPCMQMCKKLMNVTAIGEKLLFALAEPLASVCGVDRVPPSIATPTNRAEVPSTGVTPQAEFTVLGGLLGDPPRATRVGGVRYKSRSEVTLAHEALEPANIFSRGV
jgi:hypothetical protein